VHLGRCNTQDMEVSRMKEFGRLGKRRPPA
jgi:hypothetical protein